MRDHCEQSKGVSEREKKNVAHIWTHILKNPEEGGWGWAVEGNKEDEKSLKLSAQGLV